MQSIINYFIKKSFFVNFVTIILIVLGIIGFLNLRREDFPNVDFDNILVRVDFPGATSEDVEKLISISLERVLKEVDGINEFDVMSGPGFSVSNIKVESGFKVNDVLTEVKSAVGRVSDFPEDAEDPIFTKIEYRLKPVLIVAVTGGEEEPRKIYSKTLRDELEGLNGISKVSIYGNREEILDVQVDLVKLNKLQVTLGDVASNIRDRNIDVAGGHVEIDTGNVLLRVFKETKNVTDIENIVIRSNDTGQSVLLKDIASVKKTFADDDIIRRFDGERAVFLSIIAKDKSDTITLIDDVQARVETFYKKNNELGLYKYSYIDDASYFIKRRLSVLGQNAIQGMFLVFLALLAFLNLRVSVITLMGAPIAFAVSFMVMYFLGITINLISMFGLILVLGMLVDDSIIVAENFFQYVEKGMEPREAARRAAVETMGPVTGTILTTMVAFSALLFVTGIMGKFLISVPFVVIICLAASWFECFFILPSHLADFVKPGQMKEKASWYAPILKFYKNVIEQAIKHYILTILFFGVLLIISVFMATKMPFKLFPADEVRLAHVNIKGPKGSTLKATDEAVIKFTKVMEDHFKKENLIGIETSSGLQLLKLGSGARTGKQYGAFRVYFDTSKITADETNEKLDSIGRIIEESNPEYSVSIEKIVGGPPKSQPLNLELMGDSLDDLKAAANEVVTELKKIEGITSPDKDYEDGDKQLIIDINESEARRLGLSNRDIALEIRRAFEGVEGATIRQSDEDMKILVRLQQSYRDRIDTIENIYIRNLQGSRIKLSQVVTIKNNQGIYVIRRKNRKRIVTVASEINDTITTSVKANQQAEVILRDITKKYPGISYNLSGENDDTAQYLKDFKIAGLFAGACILFILVALFNSLALPLMIMTAVPLGLIGVVWIFFAMDLPISFMAMMGIIGLVGVVVNDSIVLITFIDQQYRETKNLYQSVIEGCLSRFRAVILTTFTTVAGLLPLAHAPGGDPFLKPMAISFAYGLMFSTTLTLIFVPCIYYGYFRFKNKIMTKLSQEA